MAAFMTTPIYLPDLEAWCQAGSSSAASGEKSVKTGDRALALFETVDSGSFDLDALIRKVTEAFGGDVVAETERGLLTRFKDAMNAALAALNLKRAARLLGLKTRSGLTWGPVPAGKEKSARHLRNETARRCLKIFSVALPHQILIDDDFLRALGERTEEFPEILASEPARVELAGVGREDLMEIATADTGFAAPVERHVPSLGDVGLSPVQSAAFPAETEPSEYLVCDTCGKPMKDDGSDGMLVIERTDDEFRKFHLFHRGDCDTQRSEAWRDLDEFANPECYVQFVIALLNNWSLKGLKLRDADGLIRLLMGMYRKVFRPTTAQEHLDFIGVMRLIQMMGD
jgi:hypothetical protein